MKGSEKQIKWAADLRKWKIEILKNSNHHLMNYKNEIKDLENFNNAAWWIKWRRLPAFDTLTLFINNRENIQKEKQNDKNNR